ncbi:MAG TPA: hypothetical protein VIM16_10055 [Mucilaginibacter sp.]|jgi:uncharacterized membrane protein YhiD involved in acid resistance
MKKIALMIIFCALITIAAFAKAQQTHPLKQKRDTVRDLRNQPKPHAVKGRKQRMRMQQQQIKYHQKQLKKVHDAQQKLNKELHRKDSD